MPLSIFCTAILAYVVIGNPPPSAAPPVYAVDHFVGYRGGALADGLDEGRGWRP